MPEITPESLRGFALTAKRKLRHDDGPYARNHVRAVAQRVEVHSKTDVRICRHGPNYWSYGFAVSDRNGASIDTMTANDRLIFGIFAAFAEFERELIVERTTAGSAAERA